MKKLSIQNANCLHLPILNKKSDYLVQPGVEPGPPSLLPGAYHCCALGRAVRYTTEPTTETNINPLIMQFNASNVKDTTA